MANKGKGFAGLTAATTEKIMSTGKDAVFSIGAGAFGAGIGAAAGQWSFLLSVPFIAYGAYKKSLPIMAGGIAMAYGNVKRGGSATNGVGGIDGFTEGAKERVKLYFEDFKEKLFIPPAKDKVPVAGLGNTSYFTNPYQRGIGEVDLSHLDKIQTQIAEMSSVQGVEEVDMEF